MTNRRGDVEIYVNIMEEIRNGTSKPTKIMYASNISWLPLQRMLKSLIDNELIVESESDEKDGRTDKVYGITDKGRSVLEYFSKASVLIEQKRPVEIMSWR